MSSPAANTPYNGFLFGSKIVGSHIENLQKQDIGTIEDLVVNPDTGHVRFAVLSVGSFIGKGQTNVVVPWGAISLKKNSGGEPTYMIDATKNLLEKAPTFDASKLSELYTDSRPIFDYYTITYFEDVPMASPSPSPSASPEEITLHHSATFITPGRPAGGRSSHRSVFASGGVIRKFGRQPLARSHQPGKPAGPV